MWEQEQDKREEFVMVCGERNSAKKCRANGGSAIIRPAWSA